MWILAATLVIIEGILIFKWRVFAITLIYYMEIKGYKQPSKTEMDIYTRTVVDKMIKDLFALK